MFFKNLKYPLSILKYKVLKKKSEIKPKIKLTREQLSIVKEIRSKGYFLIKNYISKENCIKIINILEKEINYKNENIVFDSLKSDQRIMSAEKISNEIKSFNQDTFIKEIGEFYSNMELKIGFTMANKVKFVDNNKGSGGGWHKDAYYNQFKSILYLNNVTHENGPFQFIQKTNKLFCTLYISYLLSKGFSDRRFSNQEIQKIKGKPLETITGSAGTLLLVDTSLIHRGSPLTSGTRYALTNYYFPTNTYENVMAKISDE